MDETGVMDALVVGAGWAGLGVSHILAQSDMQHCVLERGRIGETWRTQRWDSFHFNLPNLYSVMPGDRYDGPEPEGFMSQAEFVALLEDYARRNRLPVHTGVSVTKLESSNGLFRVVTPEQTWQTKSVVVASGSLNRPRRPTSASTLTNGPAQLDASDYRNAGDLPAGAVLVVGSAQSGCQIAEDLILAGRETYLAASHIGRLPRRYRGHDIVVWMVKTGLFDVPRKDFVDPSGRVAARPMLGALHTISLQSLSAQGVVLVGRFVGADNGRLIFADDLIENIRFGDETSAQFKNRIDEFIKRNGLDAPAPIEDEAESVAPRLPGRPILSLDLIEQNISTIVWCTGFQGDFSWIDIPGVLDAQRQPVHEDGIAPVPGVYFAGLDFASTRRSGTVMAIDDEARRFVARISARADRATA
ncbi:MULTISPECIES: NAD(P)/FAD-dependent oxidoreductase [unclassified Mesorhizobium]|uniref:flavin-containing monooxygenase n=1 Tax=unclassified Mesorhizobium TaxID=325217 RepID=UPI000FCA0A61|nr:MULTISPECIES: NAD(P)/FAD-dependent oxidoreductase [unclassified Mesorhizobium]TGP27017.1 FAD-dependent oxidoreductase [Mesorhizobium sp. M1D.F.Ca.ET.231.01.1.1]TGP38975.1 FAD-dependent oxidoreductase [Mesorhizobium sp. M1D.F.Ca.ET.234.01.1.1]TGS51182.1 FAD-dependent oxidoreductase [Mesorhizobium sp. M1D.F.Ca.ET.184.01.1.1]TGS67067.1 FAD-dependent oxidoreductase [Mesorhizobium sp. M1D.F.Ca.ET.183.01.1.1]